MEANSKVGPVGVAVACVVVGYAAIVVGCALLAPPLALIVGGGLLVALGLLIDEPKRRGSS